MSSLAELENQLILKENALATNLKDQQAIREEIRVEEAFIQANGIDPATAQQELGPLNAKLVTLQQAESNIRTAITDLKTAIRALEIAAESSDTADSSSDTGGQNQFDSQENQARAATLYSQAEALFNQLQLGQVGTSQFESEIASINLELIQLGWNTWSPPVPIQPEEPPTPPVPGEIDLSGLERLLQLQGNLKDLVPDIKIANQLQALIEGSLTTNGFTEALTDVIRESPVDPEKAAEVAKAVTRAILGATVVAGSVVISAEAAGLGQLETPASVVQLLLGITGADDLARRLALVEYETGLIPGATRHWNSINQAQLPGIGDLIRFLVRETIERERFDQAMSEQGFSSEWTDAYWVAHWREISRRDVQDAFHRGVITEAERDKLLVILDFRPDARPGISKSDLEIVGSISKRLIPRVDLRRAFKLGLLDYPALVKSYRDLGYEEDSERMAFIQANTGFEAAQNAVIREAGKLFQKGVITEDDFRATYNLARETMDDFTLWLFRYTLAKQGSIAAATDEPADAEEAVEEATEINETQEPSGV